MTDAVRVNEVDELPVLEADWLLFLLQEKRKHDHVTQEMNAAKNFFMRDFLVINSCTFLSGAKVGWDKNKARVLFVKAVLPSFTFEPIYF